jgi:hypothetical protein
MRYSADRGKADDDGTNLLMLGIAVDGDGHTAFKRLLAVIVIAPLDKVIGSNTNSVVCPSRSSLGSR